jgi:hypothetical protein
MPTSHAGRDRRDHPAADPDARGGDAGAGLFMATFVSDCYTARQATFRAGLADIDKRAGGRFVSLTPEARTGTAAWLDAEAGHACRRDRDRHA